MLQGNSQGQSLQSRVLTARALWLVGSCGHNLEPDVWSEALQVGIQPSSSCASSHWQPAAVRPNLLPSEYASGTWLVFHLSDVELACSLLQPCSWLCPQAVCSFKRSH